jgi:hypothetical protein
MSVPPESSDQKAVSAKGKTSLLLVGVHRSGTSALTRILNLLGYDLPGTLLGANDSNPLGHWESSEINRFNDEVLKLAGTHWRRLESVNRDWYASPRFDEMQKKALELLKLEYGSSTMFVLKDPRVSILLPFWLRTLEDFGADARIISLIRNPAEVAASLQARNGYHPLFGEIMWLRYVLDAEADCRGRDRVHLTYDMLLSDWRRSVERIRQELQIPFPSMSQGIDSAIGRFISASHRHQRETDLRVQGPIRHYIVEATRILDRWADSGEDPVDYAELDRIHEGLDTVIRDYGGLLDVGFEGTIQARKLRKISQKLEAKVEGLEREVAEAKGQSAQHEAESSIAQKRIATLEAKLANTLRRVADDTVRLENAAAEIADKNDTIAGLRDALARMEPLQERLTTAERTSALDGLRIEHLTRNLDQANVAAADLAREIERLRARTDEDARRIEALHDRNTVLERDAGFNEAAAAAAKSALQAALDRCDRAEEEIAAAKARSEDAHAHQLASLRHDLEQLRSLLTTPQTSVLSRLLRLARRLSPTPLLPRRRRASEDDVDRAADLALLSSSALFDAGWYLDHYPDVREAGMDPAQHYLSMGGAEGRNPGPIFSTIDYLDRYPHVGESGTNALLHFLRHGGHQSRTATADCSPTEDPDAADLIRSSEYFDEAWYLERYADVRAAGFDAAAHYFSAGATEDRDPSPRFSSQAYLDRYPDVRAAGVNPLLHYLQFGQAEDREPEMALTDDDRAEIQAIAAHPLFECAWYLERNPGAGSDPAALARHYRTHGRLGKSDPGPGFKAAWYLRVNPDVRKQKLHPFLHYIQYGEREGRLAAPAPLSLDQLILPARKLLARERAQEVLSGETRLSVKRSQWSEIEPGPDVAMLRGVPLGHLAGQDRASAALGLFCRMHNWAYEPYECPGEETNGWRNAILGESFDGDLVKVSDIWFVNEFDIRLRLEDVSEGAFAQPLLLRVYQADGETLRLCGEGSLEGDAPFFMDIRTANPFFPLLLILTAPDGSLRGVAVVPFPSLFRGGAHQSELLFQPSCGCRFDDVNQYSRSVLAEYLATAAEPLAIASIAVDLANATGAERIFSKPVRDWLCHVAHVRIAAANDIHVPAFMEDMLKATDNISAHPQGETNQRARDGSAVLQLPADALPTVAAMFSRRTPTVSEEGAVGNFVVADPIGAQPLSAVRLPAAAAAGLVRLQPVDGPILFPLLLPASDAAEPQRPGSTVPFPLAIRFHEEKPNDAALLFRRSPDASGPLLRAGLADSRPVTALIPLVTSSTSALLELLKSLARQTIAPSLDVILLLNPNAAIADAHIRRIAQAYFPYRYQLLTADTGAAADILDQGAAVATGDFLLIAEEGMTLHDHRTLETLEILAAASNVASAACLHVRATIGGKAQILPSSGGLFPLISVDESVGRLGEMPSHIAFPRATYPTAGNSLRCAMIPADVWRKFGNGLRAASMSERAQAFALETIAAGYRHLATTAVSVTRNDGSDEWIEFDASCFWPAISKELPRLEDVQP